MSAETKAAYEAELQAAKDKTEKEQAENLLAPDFVIAYPKNLH